MEQVPETAVSSPPPIFELTTSPTLEPGDHVNTVWRAMASPYGSSEPGQAVIIKALRRPILVATEIACALAGQFLKVPIPRPSIVLADPDLLVQIPQSIRETAMRTSDGQYILYGSQFVFEYPSRPSPSNDPVLVDEIWNRLCRSEAAPTGAAWDELVANPDRHHQNLRFDGESWWLFDHDKALAPLAELYARWAEIESRAAIREHRAERNQIATQMEIRRCDMRSVGHRSRSMARRIREFEIFVSKVDHWSHEDIQLNSVLTLTKDVLRTISVRLHAIELLVQQRIAGEPQPPLLWTS